MNIVLFWTKFFFFFNSQTIVELAETGSLDLSIFCSTCLVVFFSFSSCLSPAVSQAFLLGHHEASFFSTVRLTLPRPSSSLDLGCLNSPSSPPLESLPPVPSAVIHLCRTTKGICPKCTSVLLFSYLKCWKDFLLPTRRVLEHLRNRVSRNHLGTLFKCSFGASLVAQR